MILKILRDSHPKLHQIAQSVDVNKNPSKLRQFCSRLLKTLDASGGIGLAANQVGELRRIIALKLPSYHGVLINPVIIEASEEKLPWLEGCLSVRGTVQTYHRSKKVKVEFTEPGALNNRVIKEFEGLDAVCVQHEVSHLDGITISDYKKDNK